MQVLQTRKSEQQDIDLMEKVLGALDSRCKILNDAASKALTRIFCQVGQEEVPGAEDKKAVSEEQKKASKEGKS